MSSPEDADIRIRQLEARDQFAEAVELQHRIWQFDPVDLLPVRLFVVASKIGGQVLGAFDENRMVAFCLCIPGIKPGGKAYLHSHMLGVLPEYQNYGLGRKLKLAQREFALRQGVDLIEWTFDPLQVKNAFFNIERLGCIVRRYVRNQYGITSSPLQNGIPTDRLIAEWWIERERPDARCEDRIAVPNDIGDDAREVQERIAQQFEDAFRRGLAVTGFERGQTQSSYLLSEYK